MNWKQLPNIITSIRLILLVPLSFYLSAENYRIAVYIFFIAGFSDALDGFLAKKFGWVSRFGSILDPIADKALLVITMAILTLNKEIDVYLFVLVALRDIYIIFGAYVYYKNIGPFDMQPSAISKINTFAQILMVTALLVSLGYYPFGPTIHFWLASLVLFTVVSSTIHYSWVWGAKYKAARKHGKDDEPAN
jgi:cardiolipin synthase